MVTDLAGELQRGERADLELKSSLADSRKIIEAIAAMATQGGGTVVVGVRPDGSVIGASIGEGELERLVQQVLANTDPKLYVKLDEPVLEGKRLLRIRVPPGDGPHLAFGRAFHRVGPATVAMTRDEYERRLLDRLRESSGFERRLVEGVTTEALSFGAVEAWLARARARMPSLGDNPGAAELLERLHLGHTGGVSVAGWLLFGSAPQRPLPQAVIRAHAERGAATEAAVIEGTVCQQIDDAVRFVMRNVKVRPVIAGVTRHEVPELPLLAVREVIANAVAHRDYRSTAAIQLRLTDAGLEVWNPGHLPPPLTPALLRERHPSVPPNPLLARALFLAGYIEEWGTGTLRAIEAMREGGNPEPTFAANGGGGVTVTLPLPGAPLADDRAGRVLARFIAEKPFTSAQFAAKARVSARTAGLDLKRLESLGLVKRVGVGRATRWVRA